YAVQRGKFIDITMCKSLKSIKLSRKYKLVGTGQFQRRIGDNAIGHTTLTFEYSPSPPLQPASLSALTSNIPSSRHSEHSTSVSLEHENLRGPGYYH
ncbi:TPA: hypothetical protein ACQI7E_005309, partial [Escherichia coli]